jgi:F-type H+-transporting ATPase subunit b
MAASGLRDVIPYAVNFSAVVVILAVITRKPLKKFLYQRHARMKDAVESAAIAHEKAKARMLAAKKNLDSAAAEEQLILSKERSQAEIEKSEILEKAKAESQRVVAEAERLAVFEQEEASEKVKQEFLDLVVREAESSLKNGLKRDDHQAILKRAQNSIEVGV